MHACGFWIGGTYEFAGNSGETAEKSKGVLMAAATTTGGRSKKQRPSKLSPKVAWGKLLSQCSQVWF